MKKSDLEGAGLVWSSAQSEGLLAQIAESERWAKLEVSLDEVTEINLNLCANLSRFSRLQTVALLGSLLTLPDYQSNCIRLELLIALAVMHCCGQKTPNLNDVARWYLEIGRSPCVMGEDPAEDVFTTLVQTKEADYRMLEGIWESAGFYTQRIVNVIATMPEDGVFSNLKRTVRALLVVSEIICERAGLRRYQQGSDTRRPTISTIKLGRRDMLIDRMSISYQDLAARGVFKGDLVPFLLSGPALTALGRQQVALTALDRQPLIDVGDGIIVALPTAITTAVREFVIWAVREMDASDRFDAVLSIEFADLLRNTPLFGDLKKAPISWGKFGVDRLANCSIEIDRGYVIALHIFLPSIERHDTGGFKSVIELSRELRESIQKSMRSTEVSHEASPDFRRGIHILVGCGWGKGYDVIFSGEGSEKWRFESLAAADLLKLSALDEMSVRRFWRYEEGINAIRQNGVEIVNVNGVLNMFGWMKRNHGHFVPHEDLPPGRISPGRPIYIQPPLNLLRDLRIEVDQKHDCHSAWDQKGEWHSVQRIQPSPTFPLESVSRLYVCARCANNRRLLALYEGIHEIWLEVDTPNIYSSELHYRLWEMATEWLHRIGSVVDVKLDGGGSYGMRVLVEDNEQAIEEIGVVIPESPIDFCSIELVDNGRTAVVKFSAGFIHAFRAPQNIAEVAIVEGMLRGLLILMSVNEAHVLAKNLRELVITNDEARSFHMFHAHDFTDYIRGGFSTELISINSIDDAISRLGLGWRIHEAEGDVLEGRDNCTALLNKAVDAIAGDILEILGNFNRNSVIDALLLNCIQATRGEQQWRRTSAAVLGLHGRGSQVVNEIVAELSKFSGASICSRVLIEMALCACPLDSGIVPADMELGDLIAKASLLIRMGGLSDGIHFNALVPRLRISPLGDILFQDDFGNEVVEPTLTQAIGDSFIEGAAWQRRNYMPPEVLDSTREHFGEPFWRAWIAETGVDIDQTRQILDAIESKAIQERAPILRMRRSEFLRMFDGVIDKEKVVRFIAQYELGPRPRWDNPPLGFKMQDIFPWRFGRRLSLIAKPLIRMEDSEDPLLIIAPGMLRRGVLHILGSAYQGSLDQSFFTSDEMRKEWRGRAGEGHTFNHEVAQKFCQAGWRCREGVGLPEVLRRGLDRDFGDIDILAWMPGANLVCVGECKDLSIARNYSEVAALLSDYQGKMKKGKPDKLLRHLERVRLIEENLLEVSRLTGIEDPVIVSSLFVSGVVPMQYARIDSLKGTYIGGVDKFLGQTAIVKDGS